MNIKEFQFKALKRASLCRHFENEVFKKVKNKKINFPVYLSAGQEYISASIAQLTSIKGYKPLLFGQHRGHSIYLSFGGDVVSLINELLGKKNAKCFVMENILLPLEARLLCLCPIYVKACLLICRPRNIYRMQQ